MHLFVYFSFWDCIHCGTVISITISKMHRIACHRRAPKRIIHPHRWIIVESSLIKHHLWNVYQIVCLEVAAMNTVHCWTITIFQAPATICPHRQHISHRRSTMQPMIQCTMQMKWSPANLAIRVESHWLQCCWIIDDTRITANLISSKTFCAKPAAVRFISWFFFSLSLLCLSWRRPVSPTRDICTVCRCHTYKWLWLKSKWTFHISTDTFCLLSFFSFVSSIHSFRLQSVYVHVNCGQFLANSSPKMFAFSTKQKRIRGLSIMEQAELKDAPWFQIGVPREISLEVLRRKNPGEFLVRESSTKPGCFALSLRAPPPAPKVVHYLILRTPRGYKIKVSFSN